jgi:hypothetical protein
LKTTKSLFPTEARTADINTKALVYRAHARHASYLKGTAFPSDRRKGCAMQSTTHRMRDVKDEDLIEDCA